MNSPPLAVYGDNCIDRYVYPRKADFGGGNGLNVAVHLADLGARVAYFGIIGDDEEGRFVAEALKARGIDGTHLRRRPGRTSVTLIEVRAGERVFVQEDTGVQIPLLLDEDDLRALARFPYVHCTAFAGWNIDWRQACPKIVDEVAYLARGGSHVSLDFSEQVNPELAVLLGPSLRLAFVSRGQACTTAELEDTFRFFHDCGIPEVVVTLGSSGSVYSGGDERLRVPAAPVRPVDTLGAGDSYIAGWLWGRSLGHEPRRCLEEAAALAAEVCGYFGAWPIGPKSQSQAAEGSR